MQIRSSTVPKKRILAFIISFFILTVTAKAAVVHLTWGSQNPGAAIGQADGTDLPSGAIVRLGFFSLTDDQISEAFNDLEYLEIHFQEITRERIGNFAGTSIQSTSTTTSPNQLEFDGAFAQDLSMENAGIEGKRLYVWAIDTDIPSEATQHGIVSSPAWSIPVSPLDILQIALEDIEPGKQEHLYLAEQGPELSQSLGGVQNKLLQKDTPIQNNPNSVPTGPLDEQLVVVDTSGTPAGTTTYNAADDQYTLSVTGGNIWGVEDNFHFTYREISGDIETTVVVNSLYVSDDSGAAGIMLRDSATEDSSFAFINATSSGVAFDRRLESGGGTKRSSKGIIEAPVWLRLTKIGNYVRVYYSVDGNNWSLLAEDSINLSETYFLGLAASANKADDFLVAVLSDLKVVGLEAGSVFDTVTNVDIGAVGITGDTAYTPDADSYIIQASGDGIGGRSDSFHFVNREVEGDFETLTKMDSLTATESKAQAGLMVRESTRPDAPFFAALSSNVGSLNTQSRNTYGATPDAFSLQGIPAPIWLKISRQGNVFQSEYSQDGLNWTLISEADLNLPQKLLVGMAVSASDAHTIAYGEFGAYSVAR